MPFTELEPYGEALDAKNLAVNTNFLFNLQPCGAAFSGGAAVLALRDVAITLGMLFGVSVLGYRVWGSEIQGSGFRAAGLGRCT